MMGKAHSLSGAAIWLAGTAGYQIISGNVIDPAIIVMGTIVLAGGALFSDMDSYTSTVTRSFGIFGRIIYYLINGLSLLVYNLTKTRRDDDIENGHRTFTHTLVFALLTGLAVYGLTNIPGSFTIFGETFSTGQAIALAIMAFFLHLGAAGLFQKRIKKLRDGFALMPYILMISSLAFTTIYAFLFMDRETNYSWLAFVVTAGIIIHILGDTITKRGTPLLWPIKIRGKRWYDVCLPTSLRIKAGGDFEVKILTPIFYLLIAAGIILDILIGFNLIPLGDLNQLTGSIPAPTQ